MVRPTRSALAVSVACALCAGCGGGSSVIGAGGIEAYEAALRAHQRPTNAADVRFMTGMIPHHAQAVLFSGWAESHHASPEIQRLTERIVVGQGDEIASMQQWLRDREQPVPEVDPVTMRVRMPGMDHAMHMPGMLTDAQLAELDAAHGEDFDRLFLTFMIVHHQGALTMVDELFSSYGAAQDDFVYKLASDIFADQSTEIEFMQDMLDEMGAP